MTQKVFFQRNKTESATVGGDGVEWGGVGRASNQCSPLDPFIQSTVFGIEHVDCVTLYIDH